jgi:selT/selW/selH-like putative selenoprotein
LKAAFANEQFDFDLVRADGGVFEVSVEGRPVFSKKAEKRFPRYQEIPTRLAEIAAAL